MIIIPDVHGRPFWKTAVRGREDQDIIFLGDYLDPYSYEGITPDDAFHNFQQILHFKHTHPDNVTLLLGNHDLGYYCTDINMCRHDFVRHDQIRALFLAEPTCFQLCTSRQVAGQTYLLSHSFVNRYWLETCQRELQFTVSHPSQIADILNAKFHDQQPQMFQLLAMASHYRGGDQAFGSMVWSDVLEVKDDGVFVDGIVNVFGHTQIRKPFIRQQFACLDVKRAFELKDDGNFYIIEE